jgi:adenylate kinase
VIEKGETMSKRVILVTGTPCVGKTSAARLLTAKLNASYINLTDLAFQNNLIKEQDQKRNTAVINESAMRRALRNLINKTDNKQIIIDGHYAANVVPPKLATYIFVLRRDPAELRELMKKQGFSEAKQTENLTAEILDVSLVDALNAKTTAKTCEINVTGKTPQEIADQILQTMTKPKKCRIGIVDWLGKLEKEGKLDEYLKP